MLNLPLHARSGYSRKTQLYQWLLLGGIYNLFQRVSTFVHLLTFALGLTSRPSSRMRLWTSLGPPQDPSSTAEGCLVELISLLDFFCLAQLYESVR